MSSATCPSATGRSCVAASGPRGRSTTTTARLEQLRTLADELARSHPGAAASLREGIEETLTVTRLGERGRLKRTLASTNPSESMIDTDRRVSRNVKRWHNGDMCLRWTAAGMLEAETQPRKIIGYTALAKLAVAVERDVAAKRVASPTPPPQSFTRRLRRSRRRSPLHPHEIIHLHGSPSRSSTASGTSSKPETVRRTGSTPESTPVLRSDAVRDENALTGSDQ